MLACASILCTPPAPTPPPPPAKPATTEPAPAPKPLLTNKHITGLMPPWIESLMVVRVADLAKVELKLPLEMFVKHPTFSMGNDKPKDAEEWLRTEIPKCGVETFAWAGSKFTPRDYEYLHIYETTRPPTDILAALKAGTPPLGVTPGEKVGDVGVYVCKRLPAPTLFSKPDDDKNPADCYVAVIDERVIVWTGRRDTLEAVIKAYPTAAVKKPSQWPLTESVDYSGPFVILRRYDTTNKEDAYNPMNPRLEFENPDERPDIHSVMFLVRDATKAEYEVRAISPRPRPSRWWVARMGQLGPESYKWETEDTATGFHGKILYKTSPPKSEDSLELFVLFGINVFI